MTIEEQILHNLPQAVSNLYQAEMPANTLNLQETRKEFDGQITVVIFHICEKKREREKNLFIFVIF